MATGTDEKIIQAAVDLFARRGYHNTSIRDITDKVGLTKPAIYAHFQNKAEIGRRIIQLYETSYIDRLIQIVDGEPGTALDKLHRAITWASEFGMTNLHLVIAFLALKDELRTDPEFELLLTRARIRHEAFIAELFRLGIRQGLLKKNLDPLVLTSLHMAMTRGLFQEWITTRHQLDGEEFIRTFRTVFFKGVEVSG